MGDFLVWLGVLVLAVLLVAQLFGAGSTAAPVSPPVAAPAPTPVVLRATAPTPLPTAVVVAPAAAAPAAGSAVATVYTVQPGDTLYRIAVRFGTTLQAVLAANPSITDPNLIRPGDQVVIPAASR